MTLKPYETDSLERELGGAYKYSPRRVKALLGSLADGNYRETAAAVAGLCKSAFYQWLRQSPTFLELVEQAEAEAIAANVAVIKKAARPHAVTRTKKVTRGDPDGTVVTEETVTTREWDWRAAAWLIERRDPNHWRERKSLDLRNLTTEQILEFLGDLEGEGGPDPAGGAGPAGDPAPEAP